MTLEISEPCMCTLNNNTTKHIKLLFGETGDYIKITCQECLRSRIGLIEWIEERRK